MVTARELKHAYQQERRIWQKWNYTITTSTTSSLTTTMYDPWPAWSANSTSTTALEWAGTGSSTSANNIWIQWNSDSRFYRRLTSMADLDRMNPAAYPITPQEQAAEDARRRAARAERERLASIAQVRARTLLQDHLTPEQWAEFEANQRFYIRSSTGKRYEIKLGRQHNVFEVDEHGRRLVELCGHVGESVPNEDNLLAQKLMLELDEPSFLAVANRWDLVHGRRAA